MAMRSRTTLRSGLCAGLAFLLLWQVARMHTVAPVTDLVAYWSGARVLLDGGDPYSSAQMLQTEVGAGWKEPNAFWCGTPPWTLAFFVPLAALNYGTAYFVFLLFNVGALLVSSGS